jgi:hypothetical protein
MPTIEELFRSKKLSSGKTAEQEYAVRNSKDTELTSAAGLLGLPLKAATAIRRKISTTGKETLIEQETTGLRIISKLSSPIIYGTKIARFTLQQSDDVQEMKSAINISAGTGGLLGGLVNSVRGAISSVKSILGIPQNITPTKIYLNKSEFNDKKISSTDTMVILKKIKKDGAGGFFGKLIGNNLNGTPTQIGGGIAGAAVQAGKTQLKNLLLGNPQIGQSNDVKAVGGIAIYGTDSFNNRDVNDKKFLFFTFDNVSDSLSTYSNRLAGAKYLPDDLIEQRKDLSSKYDFIKVETDANLDYSNVDAKTIKTIIPKRQGSAYTKFQKRRFDKVSLQSKLGLTTNETDASGHQTYGNNKDKLNLLTTYTPDAAGIGKAEGSADGTYDDMDFVALKFYSITKDTTVQFRATITGLTETYAPSWDASKFIGNPFNFYTYSGIERTIQFNFKVYSLSVEEHIAAWQRLNFLSSLVYATYGGIGEVYTVPPFLKFTLGNMFKNKECFIDSLIYTIDDNNVWEIGIPYASLSDTGWNSAVKTSPAANYKLPTVIDVGVTLKFVENKQTTKSHYAFSDAPTAKITNTEGTTLPDVTVKSSAKLKKLDGSIIPNPASANIAAAAKASADKLLNMKALDRANVDMAMKPKSKKSGGRGNKQYILDGEVVNQKTFEDALGIQSE